MCGISTGPAYNIVRSSHIWKGISSVWSYMLQQVQWSIADDKKVRFWLNRWVGNKLLIDLSIDHVNDQDVNLLLSNFVKASGNWVWDRIANKLPIMS